VTPDQAVVAVIEALTDASIPDMVVGSLASNFHGIPGRQATQTSSSNSMPTACRGCAPI
jgi:hypothetical protein